MRSINKKIREVETKYILAFVYYFTSQYKKNHNLLTKLYKKLLAAFRPTIIY
jgi:hypothetical protein